MHIDNNGTESLTFITEKPDMEHKTQK